MVQRAGVLNATALDMTNGGTLLNGVARKDGYALYVREAMHRGCINVLAKITKKKMILRTKQMQQKADKAAEEYDGCYLCDATSKDTRLDVAWHLVDNEYPYDKIAKTHTILTPTRCVQREEQLTNDEMRGFLYWKPKLEHDAIIQTAPKNQSVPQHLHYHVITFKDEV